MPDNGQMGLSVDKRQQLIDTAFDLFYREGIHAVGINQVLQASGVAKRTLYHHFSGKEDLVVAVVGHRDQCYLQWLGSRLTDMPPGREALLALFDALDDWFNDRVPELRDFHGCFFINTCAEYGDPAHPIHHQCAEHKRTVAALIREQVQAMGKTGAEAERLAEAIVLIKEGATAKAHVEGDQEAARKARQVVEALFDVEHRGYPGSYSGSE